MVKSLIVAALLSGGLVASAHAGCLSGAVAGGVVGHVAGHHGVAGAAVGCAIGHHQAKKQERANQANPDQGAQNQTH